MGLDDTTYPFPSQKSSVLRVYYYRVTTFYMHILKHWSLLISLSKNRDSFLSPPSHLDNISMVREY